MDLLLTLNEHDIPWAAIGGFLLGLGSAMSGYAAIMTARKAAKEKDNDSNQEDDSASNLRVVDGDGERSAGGGSSGPGGNRPT